MIELFREFQRRRLDHELTDADLLERFRGQRDPAAFEALVSRHGPMVLGVCRRMLRDPAAAEDAFQATFLVLVRQAERIRKLGSVGSWLHGVALRTAHHALGMARRRRRHETEAARRRSEAFEAKPETPAMELGPWLDDELRRLPERLRRPLVLCYLQGLTKTQAARTLGLPEGTISSRLTRGRAKLRQRLIRRGLPAAVILAAMSQPPASATVPMALSKATLDLSLAAVTGESLAAGSLLSGSITSLEGQVMHAMALAKMKLVGCCVALGLATGAAGYWTVNTLGHPGQSGPGGEQLASLPANPQPRPQPARTASAPETTRRAPTLPKPDSAVPGSAQAPEHLTSARQIREALQVRTDKFQSGLDPLALEEHLNFISKAFGVTFIIDEQAFRFGNDQGSGIGKWEVRLPSSPGVSLCTVLSQLLRQLPVPATYVVRGDHISILPEEKVRNGDLLQESINYQAREGQTLEEALRQLADQHGVTILLDARVKQLGQTKIDGTLHNVSLTVAVRLLAEMADLKAVTVGNALFVTSPENAFALQQEEDGILPPQVRPALPPAGTVPSNPPQPGKKP
jgi:RNA polymerase sigma factor (sigma-70 family)